MALAQVALGGLLHRGQVVMQSAQQVHQHAAFLGGQGSEQGALALQRQFADLIVQGLALGREAGQAQAAIVQVSMPVLNAVR